MFFFTQKRFSTCVVLFAVLLPGCRPRYDCTMVSTGKAGPYQYLYERCHTADLFRSSTSFHLRLFKKRLFSYKEIGLFRYETDSSTCTMKVFPYPYKNPNQRFAINWCNHTSKKLRGYAKQDTLLHQGLKGT